MKCYVYFLYSESRMKYYVGITNDLKERLSRHNSGQSVSTKSGMPWNLFHTIECDNKATAMLLENKIKNRGRGRYLSDNNILRFYSVPLEAGMSQVRILPSLQIPMLLSIFREAFLISSNEVL